MIRDMSSPYVQQAAERASRHDHTYEKVAEAGRQHRRNKLRRAASNYTRSDTRLRHWMLAGSQGEMARFKARHRPDDPQATRELCHALWHDLDAVRQLPPHFTGRNMKRDELRELFACECALYLRQRTMRAAAE